MKKLKEYFPYLLLLIYIGLLIRTGINPLDRAARYVEEGTVLVVVLIIAIISRKFRFSNLAYFMMFIWIVLHTIGGHYTFEKVPFDWFNNFFGFERNMYDRVAHVAAGFFAFPIIELLDRKKMTNNRVVLYLFGLLSIISIAGLYEIFEWWYAIYLDPAAGGAVLGSQGDIWDAQKDMLMDTIGALIAMTVYGVNKLIHKK